MPFKEVPIRLFWFLGDFQASPTDNLRPLSLEYVTRAEETNLVFPCYSPAGEKRFHQRDWLGSPLLLTISPADSQGLDEDWACFSFPGCPVTCPGFETVQEDQLHQCGTQLCVPCLHEQDCMAWWQTPPAFTTQSDCTYPTLPIGRRGSLRARMSTMMCLFSDKFRFWINCELFKHSFARHTLDLESWWRQEDLMWCATSPLTAVSKRQYLKEIHTSTQRLLGNQRKRHVRIQEQDILKCYPSFRPRSC